MTLKPVDPRNWSVPLVLVVLFISATTGVIWAAASDRSEWTGRIRGLEQQVIEIRQQQADYMKVQAEQARELNRNIKSMSDEILRVRLTLDMLKEQQTKHQATAPTS